jgi:hypothetical protein
VSWPDQTDVIHFTNGADGRTRVEIRRHGQQALRVP